MHDDGLGDVLRSDSALDQALTGGQPQTVGRFRFFIDDERWEWSDEVQEIHGYAVRGDAQSDYGTSVVA